MTGGTELYSLSTLHAPEILFLLVVHSIEIQAQLILFSDIQTIYAATKKVCTRPEFKTQNTEW